MRPNMSTLAASRSVQSQTAPAVSARTRVEAIDAFRGFVMFLMLAEAMRLWTLHDGLSRQPFWAIVAFNTTHVPWQGCSLHDLIQPAFSFLAGAALPFSIASRRARGRDASDGCSATPSWRSVVLMLLGIFLRSMERPTDLLDVRGHADADRHWATRSCSCSPSRRCACRSASFVGDPRRLLGGVRRCIRCRGPTSTTHRSACPANWPHLYTGFLAHFNKNSNLSWAFDVWFLNLFPRESPFLFNEGGWSTLSFIPTLATMMLGHVVGRVAEVAALEGREAEGPRRRAALR